MSWQNKKIRRAGQETRQNRNREQERKREGRERESGKEAKIERENKDVETKRHFEQCDEEKMRQTHKKGVVKSCVCVKVLRNSWQTYSMGLIPSATSIDTEYFAVTPNIFVEQIVK